VQSIMNKFGPVVGRIMLSLIFLISGLGKIGGFTKTSGYMAAKGLPLPDVLLAITIVVEVGAAAMIMAGFRARIGALLLFLWMIPVTLIFHNFWAVPAEHVQLQTAMFMKNVAIMGGLLLIMAFGPGPLRLGRN